MDKLDIGTQGFGFPMPMTLIGSLVNGKPNFLAAAWVSRVRFQPPWLAVALNKTHATSAGIHAQQGFSVNIPGKELLSATDYCGMVSGNQVDKSGLFEVFTGSQATVPLIAACPVALECRLIRVVDLESHELFIGEIVGTWTEARFLDPAGKPDLALIEPFMLTMPDNRYWSVGAPIGKAWEAGKRFEPRSR